MTTAAEKRPSIVYLKSMQFVTFVHKKSLTRPMSTTYSYNSTNEMLCMQKRKGLTRWNQS